MTQGIGGRMALPLPRCLPVRSAATNISGVQLPRPVALSGVRLGAKLAPHPPTQAVRWLFVIAPHLSGAMSPAGTGVNFSLAGCPDRSRFVSRSAPTFGVWQSLQPMIVTKYLPRSTGVCAEAAAG